MSKLEAQIADLKAELERLKAELEKLRAELRTESNWLQNLIADKADK